MKRSTPRDSRAQIEGNSATSTAATSSGGTNVGPSNSGKDKSANWVATGGLVLTLFGVLGYAAGRAYVKTYWNTHGIASQFSLSLHDFVYFGYTTNVGSFSWALMIAAAASGTMLLTAAGSQYIRRKLAIEEKPPPQDGSRPRERDPAVNDFGKAMVASSFLFVLVTVLTILLTYSASQARSRADAERMAFEKWDVKAMSELELNFAIVDGKEPNDRRCGFIVEGSEKLLAVSDGKMTITVSLEGARVRSWPLRTEEPRARHAAACECGLDVGYESSASCPSAGSPKR
jgi:hypothetical protein